LESFEMEADHLSCHGDGHEAVADTASNAESWSDTEYGWPVLGTVACQLSEGGPTIEGWGGGGEAATLPHPQPQRDQKRIRVLKLWQVICLPSVLKRWQIMQFSCLARLPESPWSTSVLKRWQINCLASRRPRCRATGASSRWEYPLEKRSGGGGRA